MIHTDPRFLTGIALVLSGAIGGPPLLRRAAFNSRAYKAIFYGTLCVVLIGGVLAVWGA
jgi:hypothetical protein